LPYTAPDPQAFYNAILARLTSATGKNIGLGVAPADNTFPYAVLYPLNDELTEGALSDPHQIVVWAFQVTAVSSGGEGALSMQHRVREALIGHAPTVAGIGTAPIVLLDGSGLSRDDNPALERPLFYTTDRFSAYTSV
jgi:hypothetical protein